MNLPNFWSLGDSQLLGSHNERALSSEAVTASSFIATKIEAALGNGEVTRWQPRRAQRGRFLSQKQLTKLAQSQSNLGDSRYFRDRLGCGCIKDAILPTNAAFFIILKGHTIFCECLMVARSQPLFFDRYMDMVDVHLPIGLQV